MTAAIVLHGRRITRGDYLTAAYASALGEISPEYLRRLARDGEFPNTRAGQRRYLAGDVIAWRARQDQATAAHYAAKRKAAAS